MVTVDNLVPFLITTIVMVLLSTVFLYCFIKRLSYSIIIAVSKYIIFVVYFLIWSKYSPIVLLDDQTYYDQSVMIFENAKGHLGYLFDFRHIAFFASVAGGTHFGYYIYNFVSFWIFGPNYYSPVVLNIFVSLVTGIMIYRTLLLVNIEKKFCQFFLVFFLLHWDLLAWSSFVNLKDILVLFFVVWALNCMIRIKCSSSRLVPFLNLLLIGFLLLFVRFYLVYFLFVVALVYLVVTQMYKIKSRWGGPFIRLIVLIVMPISFYLIFVKLFANSLAEIGGTTNVMLGFIRFIMTPFPFTIENKYSFLLVSSILHWLMFPLMLYGLYIFMKRYFFRLMPFIILAMLLCVFYGSFAELQGPRHRVVLLYFITLLQALSLYELFKKFSKSKRDICAEFSGQQ